MQFKIQNLQAKKVSDFKVDGDLAKNVWKSAPKAELVDSIDGKKMRTKASVKTCWSKKGLYFLFEVYDEHIWGTYKNDDDPIYNEEAVEMFLAPKNLQEYFEIQFSPRGVKYDAKVLNPTGSRHDKSFSVDVLWNCAGLEFAQRLEIQKDFGRYKAGKWFTEIFIPFKSIGNFEPPKSIRANFFRIDGYPKQNSFQSWSPTFKDPPDFHIPEKFGIIWLK